MFPFGFLCFNAADLVVLLDEAVADPSTYTVDGLNNADGGTVTFGTAPADGVEVTVYLRVVLKRTENYTTLGDLFAITLNHEFDRIWLALQGIQSMAGRALLLGGSDIDGQGAYRANDNRISDVGDAEQLGDAVNLGTLETALAGVTAGTGFFRQLGAGAIDRTFQAKQREVYSLLDFDSADDAVAALLGGGTIFVPNGQDVDPPPADAYDVVFDYQSRVRNNVFAQGGETGWHSLRTLRAKMDGDHIGQAESLLTIESRPVGSGSNFPSNADYALTISHIKENFDTTDVVGEMDVLNLIMRQGGEGSDGCAILSNVVHYGTGFIAFAEATTQVVAAGVTTHSLQTQVGICDNVQSNYIGFFARSNVGASTDAVRIDTTSGSSWQYLFRGLDNGVDKFNVTGNGQINLFDVGGTSNKKTVRNAGGSFSILNNAGSVEIFGVTDGGNGAFSGSVQADTALVTGTASSSASNEVRIGAGLAGSAGALAGYMIWHINGAVRHVPFYAPS